MRKLNYEELQYYQEYWEREAHLSSVMKENLVALSNKLIQRAKDNNDDLDQVILSFPEDCSDFDAFQSFASVMQAYVHFKPNGESGAQMDGWFFNREVDVE